MVVSDRGYHFGPDEEEALRELHLRGIRTLRYDGPPEGHGEDVPCPCKLMRDSCPQDGRNLSGWCDPGQRCLVGHDHLDAWYVEGELFAIAHYPYQMDSDELSQALAACSELGLLLQIEGHSVHNSRSTFSVIIRNECAA